MTLAVRSILLPSIILIALGIIGVFTIDQQLRGNMELRVEQELHRLADASLAALDLSDNALNIDNIDPIAKRIGLMTKTRITFVDSEGNVMGDSRVKEELVGSMSNHLHRPELMKAKEMGFGHSKRYSETLDKDFFYVAVYKPIEIEGTRAYYFSRASISADALNSQVAHMRLALLSILLAAMMLVGAIAFMVLRWAAASTKEKQLCLENEIARKTQQIERMYELDSLLNASSDLEDAGKVVSKLIPSLLAHTSGAISIYKPSRNQLKLQLFWGAEWQDSQYFNAEQCWALRKGHEHLSHLDSSQVDCEHFSQPKSHATLCIPLIAHGETIGVMHVLKAAFEDADVANAKAIAKRLAMSIANIELKTSLRHLAFKDPLTRLYNRRYLFEALSQWVAASRHKHTEIGIIMIDLDHFKLLNDEYGHDVGDQVLVAISQFYLEAVNASDIVCRYGGEEFCIAVPEANPADLKTLAQTLCEGMGEVSIDIDNTQKVKVTGSIGVAVFSNACSSIEHTITEADAALYRAKEDGRKCVRYGSSMDGSMSPADVSQ
ncbi:diguanylate cyclase [uncultured Vibrio sp.]|uniref:sensor domain-containing diguanylate cyclase n=1 Tax=uncultured Vibrio sp. TaxID=114054 RepID=UPI0025E67411|nr:diguanylate cyclase [uncultured Vibrio sp.]